MAEPLPFPCPAGYRHFDRVSQDDCYPCIRFLYRLDAARAAVSSGEPFHESRYREHDDEGNHIWDHPVSHREDGA